MVVSKQSTVAIDAVTRFLVAAMLAIAAGLRRPCVGVAARVARAAIVRSAGVTAVPVRRLASKPADAFETLCTKSVTLATKPGGTSVVDTFQLTVDAGGAAAKTIDLFARDTIEHIVGAVKTATGAGDVRLLSNGRQVPVNQLATTRLHDLYGTVLELQLDGLRYSVNEGLRFTQFGRAAKRTLARSYLYLAAGITVVAAVAGGIAWAVVPESYRRRMQ